MITNHQVELCARAAHACMALLHNNPVSFDKTDPRIRDAMLTETRMILNGHPSPATSQLSCAVVLAMREAFERQNKPEAQQ